MQIEAPKKKSKPGKSVYAKATDTGIDPETAAKRLNVDWDTAADIDGDEEDDETEVPPAVVSFKWNNFQLNDQNLMFFYHLFEQRVLLLCSAGIWCSVFVDSLSCYYWNLSCANSFLQFSAVVNPCPPSLLE